MNKQTKILLGVGAVILAYLILKPKKAAGQSDVAQPLKDGVMPPDVVTPPPPPTDNVVKPSVEPQTKPCEVTYHNCTNNPRVETIQIPYEADCMSYQPAPPPCAPMGGGFDVAMEFAEPIKFL